MARLSVGQHPPSTPPRLCFSCSSRDSFVCLFQPLVQHAFPAVFHFFLFFGSIYNRVDVIPAGIDISIISMLWPPQRPSRKFRKLVEGKFFVVVQQYMYFSWIVGPCFSRTPYTIKTPLLCNNTSCFVFFCSTRRVRVLLPRPPAPPIVPCLSILEVGVRGSRTTYYTLN